MSPLATLAAPEAAPALGTAPAPAARQRTVITPPGRWEWIDVGELWRYRELLATFALRDIRVRYKQTVLGIAWAVIQPVMMMIVFTVFFGRLAGLTPDGVPAPLFFLTGLLPWMLFSTSLTAAAGSVVGSEGLITKIYFPRLLVPFSVIGAALVDHLIACGLLAAVMAFYGIAPTVQILLLPVVSVILAVAAAGVGTFLAAVNIVYRDVRYVVPFAIQVLMFATPTIYFQPTGAETGTKALLLKLNPLTSLVSAFRAAALGTPFPWADVAVAAGLAAVVLVLGCLYYRRVEGKFADII